MKISIATPCLNCVETIEKTIKSVIREKTSNDNDIEYIIIDGESSDGTLGIIEKYRDYVDILITEKDNGLYDAFNKCVRNATGDYVIILAADDYLLKGSIRSFKESVKSTTEVWAGSVVIFYEGYYQYIFSERDLSMLRYCCSLRHPATFFRRDVFEKYGYYDLEYRISGDRDLFIRFYEQSAKFQIEDIPIVFFSMDGVSNKRIQEQVMLEERKISLTHGITESDFEAFRHNGIVKRIKEHIKKTAVSTHTYRIIYGLIGKRKKFLALNELEKLGIIDKI